ncbi:uncharacterized protein TM35_000031480 [Trypanosoma theileri]|uniref:Uncharacterized protein n=1 Tax=Trypanosoma theileri TaxID=67003 RepID=A0A1X0P691_9TRYP|nr:uncharacterized protein TM35_000031480 [Trypanosoma theileri]ORC92395.1 hypothetical protein TM35_000031480 [Trypanosoma theileri]
MILGLTGVQQKQHQPLKQENQQQQQQRRSPLRGRRCLYCQRLGCPGIQSCWWPRARSARSTSSLHNSKIDPEPTLWSNKNIHTGSGNAVEDNLRTQISVLEREVQLLRNGLENLVPSNREPQPPAEHIPYWNKNEKKIGAVSLPSRVVIPPYTQGGITQPSSYQQEQKNTTHVMMPNVNEKTPVSSVHPEKTEPHRVEELEKLVLELVAQNTTLCRKLAEVNSVLEQRDGLLRSLFTERTTVVPPSTVPAAVQTSSSFKYPHEQEVTVMTQLLHKQEEVAQLQEEIRDVKAKLENNKEDLQRRVQEVEFLRSQLGQLGSLQTSHKDGVPISPTPVPTFNRDPIQVPSQPVSESTMVKSHEEITNKVVSVIPPVDQKTTGVDTNAMSTEIRELREKLANAERKILAWETWYKQEKHQQQQQQQQKPSSLQTSVGLVQEKYHVLPITNTTTKEEEEPRVSLFISPKPEKSKYQEHQQVLLRALPVSQPIHCLNQSSCDHLSRPSGSSAEILALDTYALISREAALREAAKQERSDLMASLLKGDANECEEEENNIE